MLFIIMKIWLFTKMSVFCLPKAVPGCKRPSGHGWPAHGRVRANGGRRWPDGLLRIGALVRPVMCGRQGYRPTWCAMILTYVLLFNVGPFRVLTPSPLLTILWRVILMSPWRSMSLAVGPWSVFLVRERVNIHVSHMDGVCTLIILT